MPVILVMLSVFSIFIICNKIRDYADKKPFKMIYYLRDGETRKEVAQKFNVKVEDMKIEGRYLMFEVRK